jgi:hypothetical protein
MQIITKSLIKLVLFHILKTATRARAQPQGLSLIDTQHLRCGRLPTGHETPMMDEHIEEKM